MPPMRGYRRIKNHVPAMTLLELTVVIVIMLSLIGILAIGAKTWKNGSDRSVCILNLQAVQKGVRSFSNLYGYTPGASVSGLEAPAVRGKRPEVREEMVRERDRLSALEVRVTGHPRLPVLPRGREPCLREEHERLDLPFDLLPDEEPQRC